MKVGVISDTHNWLDPTLGTVFKDCDEIWHAGDAGTISILETLAAFAPIVRSVYGNIDGIDIRSRVPEFQLINVQGVKILLIHIAGKPPRYNRHVLELTRKNKPDLLICGHSHILKIMRDKQHDLLYVNPGAAGRYGFHKMRTVLRFEINQGLISNMEVVELGLRSIKA